MDYFDMSKKFERTYLGREKIAPITNTYIAPEFERRSKKGCDYAEEAINEEISMSNLTLNPPSSYTTAADELEWTSAGTLNNIGDFYQEKISDIHKNYYENKKKPENNLVINHYKKKILSLVETNEVVVITGPTGCGKTTQVPQFILDSCMEKKKYCNIIVTQPRRIAAMSIAKRVSEERGWELGQLCGYRVGLKAVCSKETLLTYVTVGVLLQILINRRNMNQYTHIIIDEIHERDQSMDFLLIIVRKLLNTVSQHVKIILMSATVDPLKFAYYFQKCYLGEVQSAPVIEIKYATNYAVQIHYLEELLPLGELPDMNPNEPRILNITFDLCIRLIKQFEKIDNDENKKNSVLVFLPGIHEIEVMYSKLMDPKVNCSGNVKYKWYPLPLHSLITIEEQTQVFLPAPSGYRKIILSTNMAESSITVPGVKFVIDFCLTKSLRTDECSNFSSLQLCWASKSNCIQRAGRVGRVMEGRVYRMVYKCFYEKLCDEPVPEIQIAPLDRVVLQSKVLNMGDPKSILGLAMDPPDLSNIEWTILMLKEAGGLLLTYQGEYTPLNGDLTFIGRLMASLPVDIHVARLIIMGHLFSCLEECVIMGACLSLKSIFSNPFKSRLQAYNSKLDWADGSCSDCIAFLNVYQVWSVNHENGYFKRTKGDNEVAWAKRHFIQLRVLREVKLLVDEIFMRLREHNIEIPAGHGKVQWTDYQKALVLKIAIAGAFYPNYFGRGIRDADDEAEAVKILGGRNPFTTVFVKNFPPEQPLQLYSQLIKNELALCNEDMKITCDGSSKIYIEFRNRDIKLKTSEEDMPFDATLPGKIPLAVYRAIKFRQICKGISLSLMPVERAKKRAQELGIKMGNYFQSADDEQSGETNDSHIKTCLPGVDESYIPIVISYTKNPGHFWAYDVHHSDKQRRILQMLNDPENSLEPFDSVPSVGDMCAAPYVENGEELHYRAIIDSFVTLNEKSMAQVFFIDYGNSMLVPVKALRKFRPETRETLLKIPALAFECVLSGIQPCVFENPRGCWSEKALTAFGNMIQDGDLIASIYSVVNGVVSVELFKVDGTCGHININESLIKGGFAEKKEECYLSKMNNEIRKNVHNRRELDLTQKNAYNKLQQGNSWGTVAVEPPQPEDCNIKVLLRGPYSPLEMSLYPYIRGALNKIIQVSEESVNSVVLNSEPEDQHEKLIVAGFINQTAEGSKLSLNSTTVLPNIHGLPAIVALIFAPEVEFRVNEKQTRYTGILCGLGAEEDGRPLFPEHDFEMVFDCEITFEDFASVNRLRYFMGMLLLTEDEEPQPNIGYADVLKLQRKIKKELINLVTKKRKPKEFEFFHREHLWKQTESDLIVESQIARNYNKSSIFRFHPGISLASEE